MFRFVVLFAAICMAPSVAAATAKNVESVSSTLNTHPAHGVRHKVLRHSTSRPSGYESDCRSTARLYNSLRSALLFITPLVQITFLVAVNQTWDTCYDMGKTITPARANQPLQDGPVVSVGTCDSGPIAFNTTSEGILVTFASSIIFDASPPQCTIMYAPNSTTLAYGLPGTFGQSPSLPSCTTMDSREGYHLTQFTFAALSWE